MPRYLNLNPPKIGLLALITLYCEGAVSSTGTVAVLSFIVAHLLPPPASALDVPVIGYTNFTALIEDFERATSIIPSTQPGRTVFDLLLKRIWAIDSLHSLHEFFDGLGGLLARTKEQTESENEAGVASPSAAVCLSRKSPLGAFVRRMQVEFARLPFYHTIHLWTTFLKYKKSTASLWKRRVAVAPSTSFDLNFIGLDSDLDGQLYSVVYSNLNEPLQSDELSSTDEIERILAFQADKLQRTGLGVRLPLKMEQQLRGMIGPATTVPSLSHFAKFFDAWRGGDFTSAFDNLHRYFDYTMQSRDKTFYQYALLHMAILQADFGCLNEAISALNETIATARENQDTTCLNFSLGWLNHLNQAFPQQMRIAGGSRMNGSESDTLNFLKAKAKESKMFSLLSSALLNEARLELSHGERSITKSLQHIYQASHINIRENILAGFGSQFSMHSAVFGRLGIDHLACVYHDVLLECYSIHVPIEENIRAICRVSFTAAKAGRYDEGLKDLEAARQSVQRTLKFNQMIVGYIGLVKLLRALRRSDAIAAESILQQLTTGFSSNPDLRDLISQLNISFHVRLGSLSKAFDLIEELAAEFRQDTADICQRLYLLVVKACLYAKVGEPHKAFSVALRAASTAHRFQSYHMFWEAVGCLGNALNHLKEFNAARRLLDAIIPQCLEGGDAELCAMLYSYQADAYMGLAGMEGESFGKRRSLIVGKAELYVNRAGECFKRIEDSRGVCETLMKRSIIASVRGDESLANDWAAQYLSTQAAATATLRDDLRA